MTEPVEAVKLTHEEIDLLDTGTALFGWSTHTEAMATLIATLESILARRIKEWEANHECRSM